MFQAKGTVGAKSLRQGRGRVFDGKKEGGVTGEELARR